MNYLALVRRTIRECGITNRDIVTLSNAQGEVLRIKEWVASAYEEIQNQRRWDWLWRSAVKPLTIGQNAYSPATDWSISPLEWIGDTMRLRDPDLSVTDRQPLTFLSWAEFSLNYPYPESMTARPTVVTVRPDGYLVFNSLPDKAYIFEGEYHKTSDVLTLDTDEPSMPSQHHMAIIWGAVSLYAQYQEAGLLYQTATNNLARFIGLMMVTELPTSMSGRPLA